MLRFFALLLALFGAPAAPGAAASLTIAIAQTPGFAPALLAQAEGWFAAEGLEGVKVIRCVNGRRCLKHLADGEAELATVADTPLALAAFGPRGWAVAATFTTTDNENKFVGRADLGVARIEDLKGKRIGIVKGTSGHYFADRFLLFHGIGPAQVTLVPLDAADPVGPLLRGEVDAVGSYEPTGWRARQALGSMAVVLPTPRLYAVSYNLVAADRVADADLAKALRALARAEALIRADPARARAIVTRALGLDAALVNGIWGDYRFALGLDQLLVTTLEAQARWALREGLVAGRELPDFLDFMRPGPLTALDRRAVTLVK